MNVCITATLGKSQYLTQAVESAIGLGVFDRHIVVAPHDKCDFIRKSHSHLEVLPESKSLVPSLYSALNQGVGECSDDDYIVFLNDDDRLLPSMVKMLHVANLKDADLVIGDTCLIDSDGAPTAVAPSWPFVLGQYRLCSRGIIPFYQVATVVSARVAKRQKFRIDLRLASDLDFYMRILCSTRKCFRHHGAVAEFRISDGQLSASRDAHLSERSIVLSEFPAENSFGGLALASLYRIYNAPVYFSRLLRRANND